MFLDWRSDDRWSFVWFCSGLPSKYLVIDDRRVEAMFFAFFCMNVCGSQAYMASSEICSFVWMGLKETASEEEGRPAVDKSF